MKIPMSKWFRKTLRVSQMADRYSKQMNPPFDPPAQTLKLAPALSDFFNEEAVLDFINAQKDFPVDRETGIIEDAHWSLWHQFRALARQVKVRTTTRWPDPNDFDLHEMSEGVKWGFTGAGNLRVAATPEFRKRFLDHWDDIDAEDAFRLVVLPQFESLKEYKPGVYEAAGMLFWNPDGISPCRELLREGYFDFVFLSDKI